MSIEAINWAFAQDVERSSAKFVLVAMANRCNDNWECWPSIASLMQDTCQNRKTIFENITRLKDSGLISDTGMKRGATGSVAVYVLSSTENGTPKQYRKRDSLVVPKTVQLEVEAVPKTDISSTENGTQAVPKTEHGTISEPSVNRKPKSCTPSAHKNSFDPIAFLTGNGVEKKTAIDWLQVRREKKVATTETGLEMSRREAEKAGITFHSAVEHCCGSGWAGFKAEWYRNAKQSSNARAGPQQSGAQARIDNYWRGKEQANGQHGDAERDITGEAVRVA